MQKGSKEGLKLKKAKKIQNNFDENIFFEIRQASPTPVVDMNVHVQQCCVIF